MRRAKLEGRQIGRSRLDVNREQVVLDRRFRDVADAGREEALHFAGERLSSDERQREFQVGTLS